VFEWAVSSIVDHWKLSLVPQARNICSSLVFDWGTWSVQIGQLASRGISSHHPHNIKYVLWDLELYGANDYEFMFLMSSADLIQRTYAWETFTSTGKPPDDSGPVAVLDGCKLHTIDF
jgi:hypothetical protein